MAIEFQTKVGGIPCICKVTKYTPGMPDKVSGPMEEAEEGYPEEMEYRLLAIKGKKPIPWLEKKVTDKDHEQLIEEYHVTVLEQKHCYE